ncbi:MAG: peptidyl-prolyl cis-trans isomerase [Bacteroidetes bacterium]|nr:MAG: peptidyl-prolyl cis-trans isomerase [Bacteroidota bacterium]
MAFRSQIHFSTETGALKHFKPKNRMIKRTIFFAWALLCAFLVNAQNGGGDDPVLFTVGDTPVHVSEFEYIYKKTNGDKATFSRESLEEYLDLYIKFKLKVQRARDMKLDTIPALMQELAGYRRQLADSYLIDREVTNKLIEEAYEHSKEDVDISHILIACPADASPADTLAAYKKALEAKEMIETGTRFADVARQYSNDKSAAKNGGHIGYVTALFPNGYYALEKAAYSLPIGKLHGPIRSSAGYHILKIHDRRPARGEMEVAHILVRFDKHGGDVIKARQKIDSIYAMLEAGKPWEEVAREYSDDKITGPKGGYIGFFGINRYEQSFEDAAHAIPEDGAYSRPVQTSVGWHIIRRLKKKGVEPFNIAKPRLENAVKKDERFELAKAAMVERIKKDAGFVEYPKVYQAFVDSLKEDFLTYKWRAPKEKSKDILFSFGTDLKVTVGEFADYLQRASRKRLRMASNTSVPHAVRSLYNDFVAENALKYEESKLDEKYPDFKALMREYEEGILLFEATKRMVWDKASQDSVGLEAFFEKNKDKYRWATRAVVSQYMLKPTSKHLIAQVRDMAKHNPADKVLAHFNTDPDDPILSVRERTYEKGRNTTLDAIPWEPGSMTKTETSPRNKSLTFMKIEKILEPAQKTLKDARGYVVADYQDVLEKEWVDSLRKAYPVKVNQAVFEGLIKQ